MKARIPGDRRLSKAEKSAIRDYINTYEQDATRRLLKLVCVALHQTFGFGPQRLRRTLDAANAHIDQRDEILWYHIDKLLIDQQGLEFEREKDG